MTCGRARVSGRRSRTFQISRFGSDADVVGQYKGSIPNIIAMRATKRVLGEEFSFRCGSEVDSATFAIKTAVNDECEIRESGPSARSYV